MKDIWVVLRKVDILANILTGGGDRTLSERFRKDGTPAERLLFVAIDAHLFEQGAPIQGGVEAMKDDAAVAFQLMEGRPT